MEGFPQFQEIAQIVGGQNVLEGRDPPLTLRQKKQYLYFGHLFRHTPGPFPL